MSEVGLDTDVAAFADEVGDAGVVSISGLGTRGGAVAGVRCVSAPSGITWVQPAEMTVRCGAGTPMAELAAALGEVGQRVVLPATGTVGGALAVGHSGIERLGWGPLRDAVLQVRYVSASGDVVKAGGPTVKNVSGFDLCRLLVGSRGTLGFFADVILRTRPLAPQQQWFSSTRDPWALLGELYRPVSVLWDGERTWVLLDGHGDDIAARARQCNLREVDHPPSTPRYRWSMAPAAMETLRSHEPGTFLAEIGVGVVHHAMPQQRTPVPDATVQLHRRIKAEFDPLGRLNPGVDPLVAR